MVYMLLLTEFFEITTIVLANSYVSLFEVHQSVVTPTKLKSILSMNFQLFDINRKKIRN